MIKSGAYSVFFMSFVFSTIASGFTYEGTMYDSNGDVVTDSSVKVKAEILDSGQTCVMYERSYTLDLSASVGHFTIDLNSGSAPVGQPHTGNQLANILSNAFGSSVTCANSANKNYVGTFSKRYIRVTVLEVGSVDITDIALPLQEIGQLPFVQEAQTTNSLQGVGIASTTPANGQVLRYNSGNTRYEPSDVVATAIPWASVTGIPADIADGDLDTTYSLASSGANGLMSSTDKTKLDTISANADILAVAAGTGLTGGGVTGSVSIGLADTTVTAASYGSATQVATFTVDSQGRMTAAGNVLITDNNTTYSAVTGGANGLMIAADKTKLDAIEAAATADQSAAEMLTALKTVDGSGSGLDSDSVDGFVVNQNLRTTDSPTFANVTGAAFFYTSDRRLKKNFREVAGLEAILKMRGVHFDWIKSGQPEIGLIAQEIEAVLPELVHTNPRTGMKSVKYGNLVAPLIEATKELSSNLDEANRRIDRLEHENAALRAAICEINPMSSVCSR